MQKIADVKGIQPSKVAVSVVATSRRRLLGAPGVIVSITIISADNALAVTSATNLQQGWSNRAESCGRSS